MNALIVYADGSIYLNDLDVDRVDVLLDVIAASSDSVETVDLPDLSLRVILDPLGRSEGRGLNPWATGLLYGSGRRPMHAIVGDVILVGVTADGAAADVPDDLLALFT